MNDAGTATMLCMINMIQSKSQRIWISALLTIRFNISLALSVL